MKGVSSFGRLRKRIMRNLILGHGSGSGLSAAEEFAILKEIGWDGVFTGWDENNGNKNMAKAIRDLGLIYQSVHAPFDKMDRVWDDDERGEAVIDRLIRCARATAEVDVDIMVVHTIIGMDKCTPAEIGLRRFGRLFDAAKECGVRIALENTEGEEYLEALLNEYGDAHVGFCIDTGHELCYNYGRDTITKYGKRMFSTHLNDNMGITGDHLTWKDDAHMLPFDGIADWKGIAERMKAVGYQGELTFELTRFNRPERHTSDAYEQMSFTEYASLALERARRFAELIGE